jgi:hypothetical protein
VAVKRHSAGSRAQGYDDASFRNEIKLLSFVHHRNLVKLVGYCLQRGRLLLVYELVPRGALHDILMEDPGSLSWDRRLKIALGTALGLDYMHSQIVPPVIHGDIKPQNIYVTEDYDAKLGDFGISTFNVGLENERGRRGTLAYMDVEYVRTGHLTTKSDVYSFGIVLLQLVSDLAAVHQGQHILNTLNQRWENQGLAGILSPALAAELSHSEEFLTEEARGESDEMGIIANETQVRSEISEAGRFQEHEEGPSARGRAGITEGGLKQFVQLGMSCCQAQGSKRPSMYRVAGAVEALLEQKVELAAVEEEVPFPDHDLPETEWSVTQNLQMSDMSLGSFAPDSSNGKRCKG